MTGSEISYMNGLNYTPVRWTEGASKRLILLPSSRKLHSILGISVRATSTRSLLLEDTCDWYKAWFELRSPKFKGIYTITDLTNTQGLQNTRLH